MMWRFTRKFREARCERGDDAFHVAPGERAHVRHAEGIALQGALAGVDDVASPLHGVVRRREASLAVE
jgi:hypothetical protein